VSHYSYDVKLLFVEDAGHMGWVENPKAITDAFSELTSRLSKSGKKASAS
jgi:pimeloyl-ACP methyl ester carboxylesterase